MLVLLDWIIIRILYYLSQWFPINDVLVSRGILRVVTDQAGTETQGLEGRGYGCKATPVSLRILGWCNLSVGFERSVRALAGRRGQDSLERLPQTATGQKGTIGIFRRT